MNVNSFIIKQVLKQLKIPASAVKQLELVGAMSDVDGRGFPWDLIQLNAPMITRGLLNFAILQMNRDWVYPYWVHKQLDPTSMSYIPRSQNPLLINVTHRNWTALGSTYGYYEAIVDPRGLVTPLPREWSIDVWLITSKGVFFPSLSEHAEQYLDTSAPNVKTMFIYHDIRLELETFVQSTRRGTDIVFHRATAFNISKIKQEGFICFVIRPFNPEGVSPIESIQFKSPRIAYVNNTVGVVFAEEPDGVLYSNAIEGDAAYKLLNAQNASDYFNGGVKHGDISCRQGLAHSVSGFHFDLQPGTSVPVHCSAALDTDRALRQSPVKQTWRVSFNRRQNEQRRQWEQEIAQGAKFTFADEWMQGLFDACRLTLLQLHDADFISPGPYVYHKFWFRDAAVMLVALDLLGYTKRTGKVINTFSKYLTQEGFFRGPDGEWDSNGAVIWTIFRHYELTRSELWLREWYPVLIKAAQWIKQMRRKTRDTATTMKGLMPKSLSAEHLGMVDQYYWDSFWSLAGLKCMGNIAAILGKHKDADEYRKEAASFESDIMKSLKTVEEKTGMQVIPASPFRPFDEGAIGSICSVYPLRLFDNGLPHEKHSISRLADQYVDDKGFFHPLIHSGYNPYLTLHIAHGFLFKGDTGRAWSVADTIFRQATSTYTYPEAIHPITGGGTMGDGHHGWAASEIVMFIRNCLFMEKGNAIEMFSGDTGRLLMKGKDFHFENIPTTFGKVGIQLQYTSRNRCTVTFQNNFFKQNIPDSIDLYLPFKVTDIVAGNPVFILEQENVNGRTRLTLKPQITKLYLTFE